jgi:hypothetical protein
MYQVFTLKTGVQNRIARSGHLRVFLLCFTFFLGQSLARIQSLNEKKTVGGDKKFFFLETLIVNEKDAIFA